MSLTSLQNAMQKTVVHCEACPRLRKHCSKMAQVKRRSFENDTYWGKPVPGFGDPNAQLLIVGLAPAAHGANRTGRMFTGDRSGEWLYRALHKAGFANTPHSEHRNDGLKLKNAFITAVVKCAPPENKPLPSEIQNCSTHLESELRILKNVKVIVALGQIAMNGIWPKIGFGETKPKFAHGTLNTLEDSRHLILSYHPSQQNTFTKRLTEPMFDAIFLTANILLSGK